VITPPAAPLRGHVRKQRLQPLPLRVCMSSRGPRESVRLGRWWLARPGVFFGGDGSRVCMGGAEPGGGCGRLGWRFLVCPAGAVRSTVGRARAWLAVVRPGVRAGIMMATWGGGCPDRDRAAGRSWRRGLSAGTECAAAPRSGCHCRGDPLHPTRSVPPQVAGGRGRQSPFGLTPAAVGKSWPWGVPLPVRG
jgi:hypothetical protein